VPGEDRPIDAVVLDEALTRLAGEEPVAARVVEMRFFAGLQERVIGEALGVTERTVRRHWTFAKAWLYRELRRAEGGGA
jgi:DNA-directed RNA polymerase specialized sigma24 family protein